MNVKDKSEDLDEIRCSKPAALGLASGRGHSSPGPLRRVAGKSQMLQLPEQREPNPQAEPGPGTHPWGSRSRRGRESKRLGQSGCCRSQPGKAGGGWFLWGRSGLGDRVPPAPSGLRRRWKLTEGGSHSRAGAWGDSCGATGMKCGPGFGSEAHWFYKETMPIANIHTALQSRKHVLYICVILLEPWEIPLW